MKFKKGFTIIEVIVVIGIIGLLSALIYPSITQIKSKNRDTERIADISTLQLGLSLYKNQNGGVYPTSLADSNFSPQYVPADALVGPDGKEYDYVPLTKVEGGDRCTYYHLAATLDLLNSQIDQADTFNSKLQPTQNNARSNYYYYCGGYSGLGIDGTDSTVYDVHP